MEKWVYGCMLFGLSVVVVIKYQTGEGRHLLSLSTKSDEQKEDIHTDKINHTEVVTDVAQNFTSEFEDITRSRTCIIQSEDALSALQRVETVACRERLTTIACLNQEQKLYPETLPRFCPLKVEHEKGTYLGCYKDSKTKRDLTGYVKNFGDFNSPETCIEFCLTGSYMYAGLQWKYECWCSNTFGSYGTLPEWACSSPCPGNKSETCGGANSNRIFSTGFHAKESTPSRVVFSQSEVEGLKPVRIAFVLTVYGRAVRQVKRLIKVLYRPYHYFLIHVDSRSQYMYRELVKLEQVLPNLRLSRERFPAIWAGISLLQAHFSFMKSLLDMTDWTWDYYMNLSESDYLVKPLHALEWYLTKYKGNNYIACAGKKSSEFEDDQALLKTFYECDRHMWRLGSRTLPKGIGFDGGSDWVTLHRDFVEYIMTNSDPLVRGLKRVYEFTSFSTESFFHTLIANSAFCGNWINANLHMINWKRDLGCQCQQKHIIDWCGCSPNDIKQEDMHKIKKLYNDTAFFARKFEPIVSNNIINDVDFNFHKDIRGIQGYRHYWHNEYDYLDRHHKDHNLFITAMTSILRRTHQIVDKIFPECRLRLKRVLETNLLFVNDKFHSYLVKYSAVPKSQDHTDPVTLEARFSTITHQRRNDPEGRVKRLRDLEVGTDYDVKEQIFRNFGKLIGVDSHVSLRHSWAEGKPVEVGFSWIDPAGMVAQYKSIKIEKGKQILQLDPDLKTPLRPGEWVIKVTQKQKLVAEMKFIVLPFSIYNGKKVTKEDVEKYHNGPDGHYFIGDPELLSGSYIVTDKDYLSEKANINGQKLNYDLLKWIDDLSGQVWGAEDICTTAALGDNCPPLEICNETKWSSVSPDPKSEITQYFRYKSVMGYYR